MDTELLFNPWFQQRLKEAASTLLDDDEIVIRTPLEKLYEMMDPDFLFRSNLIVSARNLFDIDYDVLESMSNDDLQDLLGIAPAVVSDIKTGDTSSTSITAWKDVPIDVQLLVYAQMSIRDVERVCIALGLKYCVDNRIFTRLFTMKHSAAELKAYKERHPNHLRPSWMLRAYEVGKFLREHIDAHDVVFGKNESYYMSFRDKALYTYNMNTSETDEWYAKITKDVPALKKYRWYKHFSLLSDIADEDYVFLVEAITYAMLRAGFTITKIGGEVVIRESWGPRVTTVEGPDLSQRICSSCGVKPPAGTCSSCKTGMTYCQECFNEHALIPH